MREEIEKVIGSLSGLFLSRRLVVGRISDRGKRFAKSVSSLANRFAILSNMKEHAAVGVKAMAFDKVESRFGPG